MLITIQDLKFQCIIGLLDFERTTPQDLIVNLEIQYIYTQKFIDYALVRDLIKSEIQNEKFLLIEDALNHLFIKLKEKFSLIDNLKIKITKPSILNDCDVSVSHSVSFNS